MAIGNVRRRRQSSSPSPDRTRRLSLIFRAPARHSKVLVGAAVREALQRHRLHLQGWILTRPSDPPQSAREHLDLLDRLEIVELCDD